MAVPNISLIEKWVHRSGLGWTKQFTGNHSKPSSYTSHKKIYTVQQKVKTFKWTCLFSFSSNYLNFLNQMHFHIFNITVLPAGHFMQIAYSAFKCNKNWSPTKEIILYATSEKHFYRIVSSTGGSYFKSQLGQWDFIFGFFLLFFGFSVHYVLRTICNFPCCFRKIISKLFQFSRFHSLHL